MIVINLGILIKIQKYRLISCQDEGSMMHCCRCVVKCNWCWRWMVWETSFKIQLIEANPWVHQALIIIQSLQKQKIKQWSDVIFAETKNQLRINDYRILLWAIVMTWLYKVVAMWWKNCINFSFLHFNPNYQNLVVFLKLGVGGNIGCETKWNIMNNFNLKHLSKFQWWIIRIGLWGIFWNPSFGCPWTIPKTILETNIPFSSLTTSFFFKITISQLS